MKQTNTKHFFRNFKFTTISVIVFSWTFQPRIGMQSNCHIKCCKKGWNKNKTTTEHTNALFSKVMTLKSKIGCKSAFLDFSDIRTRERKKHRFHKTNRNSIDKKMDGKKDFFVFSIAGFTTEERFNIVHWNE